MALPQKLTGTVKWFNEAKGYGFITPDKKVKGMEDLFVHQSSIYSLTLRTLFDGERVEFLIQREKDGRSKAVQVGGPNGTPVKGKEGNKKSNAGMVFTGDCYRCNLVGHMAKDCPDKNVFIGECRRCHEVGHMARDCPGGACYSCGERGHLARDCPNNTAADYYNGKGGDDYYRDPTCYNCGKLGHFVRNCKAPKKG